MGSNYTATPFGERPPEAQRFRKRRPRRGQQHRNRKQFGLSIDQILGGSNDPSPPEAIAHGWGLLTPCCMLARTLIK